MSQIKIDSRIYDTSRLDEKIKTYDFDKHTSVGSLLELINDQADSIISLNTKCLKLEDEIKNLIFCKNKLELTEFYQSNTKKKISSYCKKCENQNTSRRLIEKKIKMAEYKGGKCNRCPLDIKSTHYSVFEFHHKNPSEKDPNFKGIRSKKWDFIKNELDKCVLLCANCHRITHAEINENNMCQWPNG